jgi:pimeloyl-ACP methyl ester carboxylesterase
MNMYTTRKGILRYLREEVYANPAAVTDALVDHHYKGAHEPANRAALAAYLAGYLNHRVAPALARLETPTLLVWGRQAVNPPVETADLWLAVAKEIELEVLERAGTLPHVERPNAFAKRLAEFVERLPGG